MSMEQIRIMVYRHSAFYSPLLATMAAGFLKDEGLEAVYFVKPKERNLYEMFRQGEVDIMQAAVSTSWDPLSRGVRDIPRHFAQINERDGFFVVGRKDDESFSWKNLEGAELIADHSQQPLVMMKYALHVQGVDWKNVRSLNAGDPEASSRAFREGRGDYVHLQGPAAQQLELDGVGFVCACVGDALPRLAFSSLMAMTSFLNTAKARAFMRAYRHALNWVNDEPASQIAKRELAMFGGLSEAAWTSAIARYQRLGTWRRDPVIPKDQYEVSMDAFIHAGIFSRRLDYNDVVFPAGGSVGL
jgi:NitT/TauT family transport system substrate-binding protein